MPPKKMATLNYNRPPPHLRVPPGEDLSRLPRCLWTDPADFQPGFADDLYSSTSQHNQICWGIPLPSNSPEDVILRMMRNGGRLGGQGHGLFDPATDDPLAEGDAVTQYRRLLAVRKAAAIERRRKELPEYEALCKSGYLIKVTLMSLPGDRGASAEDKAAFDPAQGQAVWRRLRVCGGTSLRALHDRILQPALGWCRRYHSYYFTDVTDGSQFGPEDEGRIDEMHRQMFGEVFLDDRRYALADLVAQPGDRLRMEYDLGDHWQCILEVEDVVPDAPAFALLGGQGAWAPEDSNGCPNSGNLGYLELLRKVRRDGPAAHAEALREAAGASACHPYQRDAQGRLRLFHFEPGPHEAAVMAALAEPFGKADAGPKTLVTRRDPVRGVVQEWVQQNTLLGIGPDPGKQAEALKLTALCGGCGSPHGLKLCSLCRSAKFCSKLCQETGWALHKRDCKKLAAALEKRR